MRITPGYIKDDDGNMFKIESCNDLEYYATCSCEISDWIGNPTRYQMISLPNSNNKLIVINYQQSNNFEHIAEYEYLAAEAEAILDVAEKIADCKDAFVIPIKRTEQREQLWTLMAEFIKRQNK